MRVIRRDFYNLSRNDTVTIVPIFDPHIGAAACNEQRLIERVNYIKADPLRFWIGGGDMCLSEDTEILTDHGWRTFDALLPTDLAVTYAPNSGATAFEPILKKWINPVDEPLIHLRSGHIDALVTQNHRVLVHTQTHEGWQDAEILEARLLRYNKTKHRWRIPVAVGEWNGLPTSLSEDWFSLKGWIDAEGCEERKHESYRIQIGQSRTANPDKLATIEALLNRLQLTYSRYEKQDGMVLLRLRTADTARVHSMIGRKGRRLDFIMNAPRHHLLAYFNALMDGDGTRSRQCFFQKEKHLVEIFAELCFKLGYRAKISHEERGWFCHYGSERTRFSLLREVEDVSYRGNTWCITTPTGIIVTRRNNQIVVLGNCDFITRKDKRFEALGIAKWCREEPDIVGRQIERFESIFAPIKDRCIAFVRGNHEEAILRYYERDVYSDMLKMFKRSKEEPLGVGTYGWLLVGLYRSKGTKERGCQVRFNLHHGFTGGRLAGAKALNIQRWLWTHDCDVALQGHSHNSMMQAEMVEGISDVGEHWEKRRFGIFCGTFLNNHSDNDGTYSEVKGYMPQGQIHWEIKLRPVEDDPSRRVEVVAI